MYKGHRYIDNDAHVLEPSDLWDRYLEPRFRSVAPRTISRWEPAEGLGMDPRIDPVVFHQETHMGGHSMPDFPTGSGGRGTFQVPGTGAVYQEFMERGFAPECYRTILDRSGIDRMAMYPTAGLTINAVPNLAPEPAAAIRRAYNNWLHDFLSSADARLMGVGTVDLRDPREAAKEARRCITKLGFKGIQINPEPVKDYPSLHDTFFDPLWAELEDLDVPLAIHLAPITKFHGASYYFGQWALGVGATAFITGNMMASTALIVGGALERHPKLRVVHLETGCGWVPFWMERLEAGVMGMSRGMLPPHLKMRPLGYFQRQCFVSGDPDDPWIKHAVESIGDDCIVTATDFGHPEGKGYTHALEDTLSLPGVSDASKRKIMWENGARLYAVSD